jgi:tRNA-2-methylthio-N6-dimethylallyladenosine synthase
MNKQLIKDIDILGEETKNQEDTCQVKISEDKASENQRKVYIESYGCQMNFSDSEIVMSVMNGAGFGSTSKLEEADLVFLNTCAIRDKAEQTIRTRLQQINGVKKRRKHMLIGVLGCMAERLKHNLLEEEKMVDLVAGPDAYRDLPKLVQSVDDGQKSVNVLLSREETYADIAPLRLNSNGISAFISIMRGCDNVCAFCVVPFTRGKERSRSPFTIINEAKELVAQGFKEVTLLGQNVDSFRWTNLPRGVKKENFEEEVIHFNFAQLLEKIAQISPSLRVRFTTSHPKDMTDEVLEMMAKYDNICNFIHLPFQSGNDRVLKLMNRSYTREWYLDRIEAIRRIVGEECGISSDMISGFCSETEEEHQDTLSLMREVKFDYAYMYFYSERPGTLAAKKYEDDVPLKIKKTRLQELITLQRQHALLHNQRYLNRTYEVLIEGYSKRSDKDFQGRTSCNKMVIFPCGNHKLGDYVDVLVTNCSSATLLGKAV